MKNKNLSTSHSSPSSSSFSSFFSPSSSSSLNFDPTMCTSKKATAGCLTGILRRILCSRALPTHPSDQIRDVDSELRNEEHPEFKAKHKFDAAASSTTSTTNCTAPSAPGIVARLMGLESMVEMPTESSATSLSRSRSMNSVECFGECDRMQGIHRRVKSTLSFRDVPGFLLLENDDNFLVLSFEGKGIESRGRERGKGSAEIKQRRNLKENRRETVSSEKIVNNKEKQSRKTFNDGKLREVTNTLSNFNVSSEKKNVDSEADKFEEVLNTKLKKRRRRRKKKKTSCNCSARNTELESNSEESSPVSVLDFDRQAPESEADSVEVSLNSRRKLSPETGNDQHFLLRFDGNLMVEQRKMKAKEGQSYEGAKRKDRQRQREEYMDNIWDEACRKAEDEIVGSKQIWEEGDWESISEDFESQIFYYLVDELIDQLLVEQLAH